MAAAAFLAVNGEATEIEALAVDRLVEPGHIGSAPSFSWRMKSARKGARQTAYRISVTDESGKTLWSSGAVAGDRSTGIKYAGLRLASARRYRWKVSVKDELGKWTFPKESHLDRKSTL
jgi:alpha-L-rhamnosidase